jgi:uncharacterized protein YbaR (Trm112 family)
VDRRGFLLTSLAGFLARPWAALMRRAFDLDVLACPRCGGRLRLIATVEDPGTIRAILGAVAGSGGREGRAPPGAAGEPPSPARARTVGWLTFALVRPTIPAWTAAASF